MSKSWNIIQALKEKGPMTKTELWSHFKASDNNVFRSITSIISPKRT